MAAPRRAASAPSGLARGASTHGAASEKKTGRPAAAAASTRAGRSACPGTVVAHATRSSASTGADHCGSAGSRRLVSSPAAARSGAQSTGAAFVRPRLAGGTTSRATSRPRGSNATCAIPSTRAGGSVSLGDRSAVGASGTGLSLYQK